MRRGRKKVRGLRRHAARVEAFRERFLDLDERVFAEGRDWVKLWVDPWYRLVRREPPGWLRHRMLGALLDIHRSWHGRLERHEREAGVPFDCQLWILGPDVVDSQVVASVGAMRAFYRDTFYPAGPDAPPTPSARYRAPGLALDALDWRPVLVPTAVPEAELDGDPALARDLARHPVLETTEVQGEAYRVVATGYGWVGRLPGSTPADGRGARQS